MTATKVHQETQAVAASASASNGYLTIDAILAADDLGKEIMDMPEWGGKVLVYGISGAARDFLADRYVNNVEETTSTGANFQRAMVAYGLLGPSADRDEVTRVAEGLAMKAPGSVGRIFQKVMELSGIGPNRIEEVTKALKDDPSGKHGSD